MKFEYFGDMPISSINAGTDIISTSSDHNLTTGTALFIQADEEGTQPLGTSNSVAYFCRALSSENLTLHTTASGAIANTGLVDITGAGVFPITLRGAVALLANQSKKIISLILDAQAQLKRRDVVQFFRANVGAEIPLLKAAQKNLKSYLLVIRGLRESIGSTVLPSVGDSAHDEGWLNVGDVFVGWIGYSYDRPYVITAKTDNKYNWRYIDEEVERSPMLNDPGLRLAGWIKIPIVGDVFGSILDYQQKEMDALQQQVQYFQTNQFAI